MLPSLRAPVYLGNVLGGEIPTELSLETEERKFNRLFPRIIIGVQRSRKVAWECKLHPLSVHVLKFRSRVSTWGTREFRAHSRSSFPSIRRSDHRSSIICGCRRVHGLFPIVGCTPGSPIYCRSAGLSTHARSLHTDHQYCVLNQSDLSILATILVRGERKRETDRQKKRKREKESSKEGMPLI